MHLLYLWWKSYSATAFPRILTPPAIPALSLIHKNLLATMLASKKQAKRPLYGLTGKRLVEEGKFLRNS